MNIRVKVYVKFVTEVSFEMEDFDLAVLVCSDFNSRFKNIWNRGIPSHKGLGGD